jgi:hypothetical protein
VCTRRRGRHLNRWRSTGPDQHSFTCVTAVGPSGTFAFVWLCRSPKKRRELFILSISQRSKALDLRNTNRRFTKVVEVSTGSSSELIEAMHLWTGWGQYAGPNRNNARVTARFGPDKGNVLLKQVRSLAADFYSSSAPHIARNTNELVTLSVADFRRTHPDVPTDIVDALVWCYTCDYR